MHHHLCSSHHIKKWAAISAGKVTFKKSYFVIYCLLIVIYIRNTKTEAWIAQEHSGVSSTDTKEHSKWAGTDQNDTTSQSWSPELLHFLALDSLWKIFYLKWKLNGSWKYDDFIFNH